MFLLFSCSVVSDSSIPWNAASQASLSFTISLSLLRFMFTESVMPSNHLILCQLLLLLPSVFSDYFSDGLVVVHGGSQGVRHDLATEQQVVVNSFFNAGILLVTKLGLSWQVFSLTILKLLL